MDFKAEPIGLYTTPDPTTSIWFKLKEKALSENNEVGDKILRMMVEIEMEVVKETEIKDIPRLGLR
jgi:hypothetical protein